jgi:ribosomal protein L2
LPIEEIPVGSYIHVAPTTSKEAQISRAAGTFTFERKNNNNAKIELSSGEQRFISPKCYQ